MCRFSFSAARTTFLAALAVVACTSAQAGDWPQWRGPTGDGRMADPGLAEAWPESGLRQLWRRELGGGYSGIAVVGDKVITQDRQKEPHEVERVVCVDVGTGEPVWVHEYDVIYGDLDYGNGPRACPTIVGDRVYTLGALGHLRCLNLANGSLIWQKHLETDLQGRRPTWGYAASPLVTQGRVIVQPGGDNGYSVVALSAETGDVDWHCLSDEAGYTWPLEISSGGTKQLVCWTPSHIRGIEPATGRPLWEAPYEVTYGVAIATPIFCEGLIVVSGYWHGSKAIRLGEQPEGAKVEWEENRYLRGLMSQPLYRDGVVYLLDKQYGITAFELQTGRKLWDDKNQTTPRDRNPQASLVWIGDSDRALALSSNGDLVMIRLTRNGLTELARDNILKVDGVIWGHPAYSGQRVFARSDTELICVELPR